MTETTAAGSRPAGPGAATEDPSIRPFHVDIPDEELAHARHRPGRGVKGFETGDPPPSGLSDEERTAYEQLRAFYAKHVAYAAWPPTPPISPASSTSSTVRCCWLATPTAAR
jgi:hypothetical protein